MAVYTFQIDASGNVSGKYTAIRGRDSIAVTGSTDHKVDAVQTTDHQKNKTEVLIQHHHIKVGPSHLILDTAPTGTYAIAAESSNGDTTTGTLRVLSGGEDEDPEGEGGGTSGP
jgi:hypothetical protein